MSAPGQTRRPARRRPLRPPAWSPSSGPEYMRLSLSGDRPEEQKVLVAEVTNAYLTEIVNRERTKRVSHLERLKEIQTKLEQTLTRKRRSAREMTRAVGPVDPQVIVV